MEYCSKAKGGCALLEVQEQCVNSMSLPSLLQVRRSVIAFLHTGNTQTHTHSHRPLCSSSRQSCWETASSWLAPSQSQALLVFHTQVEKRSYPKPETATVYPRKKNPCKISFSFCFSTPTPQIIIRELSLAWIWNAVYQKVISGPFYSWH